MQFNPRRRYIRTTTEVHDLKTGRLKLRDLEDILEMLVEDIEETVGKSPEEEKRCDECDREDERLASQISALDWRNVHRNTTASHDAGVVAVL